MITQPLLPRKVCLLAWSGWLGLLPGSLEAQQPPYVFTSEEVHVRGLRVAEIGDTAALRPSEWESLLPRTWKAYRQWTHDGLDAATGALRQSYLLPGTAWIDRIRPGPLGAYVAWDRGIHQLGGFGARKSHARSTLLSPVVATFGDGVVCRDERFLYRLGP